MNLIVSLTTAGTDTGPYNIFSNVDYTSALISGVTRDQIIAGVSIPDVPDATTIIRIKSIGKCKKTIEIPVVIAEDVEETTTTSTTITTSSTTTTTTTQPVLTAR